MIANKYIVAFFAIIMLWSSFGYSDNLSFEDIPIQEEGRIKPLDTFAKNQLLRFYGKRTISYEDISSVDWLFGVLTNDQATMDVSVFNIRNPEVADALGLDRSVKHKYSFTELQSAIISKIELFDSISKKSEEDYSLVERQLTEIYFNVMRFSELASSLSCLNPSIEITHPVIADRIGVAIGDKISFFTFVKSISLFTDLVDSVSSKDEDDNWTDLELAFHDNLRVMDNIYNKRSNLLKIIPLPYNYDSKQWISPWELLDRRELHDTSVDLLIHLENYINARLVKDDLLMEKALLEYQKALYGSSDFSLEPSILKKETWYNNINLFYKSITFYILAFFALCLSLMIWKRPLRFISLGSISLGFFFHSYGLYSRMLITGRPPVSTLYESIIFVGFISVLCALILEYFRKDGLGLLIGSIAGLIFHYVSFGYAADGDTMGVLVAVLNSNFWLATHVTTITTGYGISIVAGIMGHILLIYSIIHPGDRGKLKEIYNNTFGVTLLALFFTLFGTILGGIWADQSWGRFWGWDPKENGALLICMWQIFMIHLRLTGMVKGSGFCFGMVINIIIVTLAWFGVNLLSIGLHSYGFASGIALNLSLFILFELVLGGTTYYISKKRIS